MQALTDTYLALAVSQKKRKPSAKQLERKAKPRKTERKTLTVVIVVSEERDHK